MWFSIQKLNLCNASRTFQLESKVSWVPVAVKMLSNTKCLLLFSGLRGLLHPPLRPGQVLASLWSGWFLLPSSQQYCFGVWAIPKPFEWFLKPRKIFLTQLTILHLFKKCSDLFYNCKSALTRTDGMDQIFGIAGSQKRKCQVQSYHLIQLTIGENNKWEQLGLNPRTLAPQTAFLTIT